MRLTIRAKLALAFTLVLGCLGLTAHLGVSGLGASNDRLTGLVANTVQHAEGVLRLRYHAAQVSRNSWKLLALTGDADMRAADRAVAENLALVDQLAQAYRGHADAAEIEALDEAMAAWSAYLPLLDQVRKLGLENSTPKALALISSQGAKAGAVLLDELRELVERVRVTPNGETDHELVQAILEEVTELRRLTYVALLTTDDAELARLDTGIAAQRARIEAGIAAVAQKFAGALAAEVQRAQAAWAAYLPLSRELVGLAVANTNAKAAALAKGEGATKLEAALAKFDVLVEHSEQQMKAEQSVAAAEYGAERLELLAIALAALVVGAAAASTRKRKSGLHGG
jgi:hypothetical protein